MTKTAKGPGGRPPLYSDPEVMQAKIDEYFASLALKDEKPTIAGMCYFLGFEDRGALVEYGNKPEFSRTIKKARLRVEQFLEQALHGNAVTGIIFNLKNNFGWKDRQELEHTGKDGAPIEVAVTDRDRAKAMARLLARTKASGDGTS